MQGISKGKLEYHSRVVSSLKGGRNIGDKLLFAYNIESAPSWLNEFESTVSGELKYLFFNEENLIKKGDGTYSFDEPNQSGYDYYDGSLNFLIEKIGRSNKMPE